MTARKTKRETRAPQPITDVVHIVEQAAVVWWMAQSLPSGTREAA